MYQAQDDQVQLEAYIQGKLYKCGNGFSSSPSTRKPVDGVSITTMIYKLHELLRTAAIRISTGSHDTNK